MSGWLSLKGKGLTSGISMAEKIKVMIVDDSAVVRQVVAQALADDPGIEVVAPASDPLFALE